MKYLFLVTFVITSVFANAQSLSYNDIGVLLTTDNVNGTARFNAMGGAFGALGGDLSATAINPASGAVFLNSQLGISLSYRDTSINTNFYGNSVHNNEDFFNLPQVGGVFIFETGDSQWSKIALGLNYNLTHDYNNNWISKGNSGMPDPNWVADPINDTDLDPSNDIFYTNVDNQSFENFTDGLNSKFTISLASQYGDNLYLGLSINAGGMNFNQQAVTKENLHDNTLPNPNLLDASFTQDLSTEGDSFSFGLGLISKIATNFRLGLAYQSPTWYTIYEEFIEEDSELTYSNVNITDVYNSGIGAFEYRLRTPSSLTGSLAYVFNKKGTVSFDYIYKNYSNIQLNGDTDFTADNATFKSTLKTTSAIRIGGEFREKQLSIRAGYHMEESPYKHVSNEINTGYSFGLGYNFGMLKIDLTYENNSKNSTYAYHAQPNVSAVNLETKNSKITTTLVFDF